MTESPLPVSSSPASWEALLFEVESIQSYIFGTGRLRDAVGASDLLHGLLQGDGSQTPSLLDRVLEALGPEARKAIRFSRRAGGAFYAFAEGANRDRLHLFAALWTTVLARYVPELRYRLRSGTGSSAREAFDDAWFHTHAPRPRLPLASPVTLRSPRTGLPAVTRKDAQDGPIDLDTKHKKAAADLAHAGFVRRFSPRDLGWKDWPTDLGPDGEGSFPFEGDLRVIAVVHGDGNGMGKIVSGLRNAAGDDNEKFLRLYADFSRAIDEVAQETARKVTEEVLIPARKEGTRLPARPLILGGDDLLVIVRADLALRYVGAFATAFEEKTRERFANLRSGLRRGDGAGPEGFDSLPAGMSMGFGVTYISASQPFALAARLAEYLMGRAKKDARPLSVSEGVAPSTVVFHRVTASLRTDPEGQFEAETEHRDGNDVYVHTLGTYVVGSGAGKAPLPALADLVELQRLFEDPSVGRGTLHGLLNVLESDPVEAKDLWYRWREVLKKRNPALLKKIDTLMLRLFRSCGASEKVDLTRTPFAPLPPPQGRADSRHLTPVADALVLSAVKNAVQKPAPSSSEERPVQTGSRP